MIYSFRIIFIIDPERMISGILRKKDGPVMKKAYGILALAALLCGAFVLPGGALATEYREEMNIAITANPPSLEPHSVNSNIVGAIGSHIYEPLFAMNARHEPTAVLAESYDVSADGKVYTIKLRRGVKFHNGQEMKAEDVAASMTHWLGASGKAKALLGGTVFAADGDYTVTMTMPEAYGDALSVLAAPVQFAAVYPRALAEEAAAGKGLSTCVGTGPYRLKEWKQDQYVLLERYDSYRQPAGEPSGFAGRKGALTERLCFRVVVDPATRVAGLQTGQFDVVEDFPADRYAEVAGDKSMVLRAKTSGTLNMFLNTTKGIMANRKMRQAILAAMNCSDVMLASYGEPDLYILDPGWCNPDDALWGSDAGREYYNQNNPEKAKKLLAEAGYENEKIVLVTTADYAEMYNATLAAHDQLRKVGINAEVQSYDFATFMERRSDPDKFSLFITSNGYNMTPVQLAVLMKNWAGLDVPEIPEGIAAIRRAASPEEASKAWAELQRFLYEYGAAIVFGHYSDVFGESARTEGVDLQRFALYWNARVAK